MSRPTDTAPRPRSAGQRHMAKALWYIAPRKLELRTEQLAPLGPDEARVRTHYTAISRGTERLVCLGAVPESEWPRMRAPQQSGSFPFPVKYGYSAAGVVEAGPPGLERRNVFSLHPHQDLFVTNSSWLVPIPDGIPLKRATLAANMETALNAIWDSGACPGDRIVVVGAGIVGLLTGHLAARLPGADVTVVDVAEARRPLVEALGARFATPSGNPDGAPDGADVVFHTTATGAGLETALSCAGFEATIVEMSWYGANRPEVSLGGPFHSQRLRLISTQVGHVSDRRRSRWTHRRRMELALSLLDRPELDLLVENEVQFPEASAKLPDILTGTTQDLPPVIRYL